MRLIDATTLKAEFTGNFRVDYPVAMIKALIDLAPTVGGWISVRDKLPEQTGLYIVYGCSDAMKELVPACVPIWLCSYSKKRGGWYEAELDVNYDFITHWMPLPLPPKEVSKDG